jgi:hypothetical protein
MAKPRRKPANKQPKSQVSSLSSKRSRKDLGLTGDELEHADVLFSQIFAGAKRDLKHISNSLEAEMFGSAIWGLWWNKAMIGVDTETVMSTGLRTYLLDQTSPMAGVFLHTLASVAPPQFHSDYEETTKELELRGFIEPAWASQPSQATPTRAVKVFDPVHDDGVVVIIGFDHPDAPHCLDVLIDNNADGIAKDAFIVLEPIESMEKSFQELEDGPGEVVDLPLDEARALVQRAFDATDTMYDPPVADTFEQTRAIAIKRIRSLPEGFTSPAVEPLTESECSDLVNQFLKSPYFKQDDYEVDAETLKSLAGQILNFSNGSKGVKLRFSPTMVEIFLCDWAVRKISVDPGDLEQLPKLLKAWISFVDNRRHVPAAATKAAHRAVDTYTDDLLEAKSDQPDWERAKLLAQAIQAQGIDVTDEEAIQALIDEINSPDNY